MDMNDLEISIGNLKGAYSNIIAAMNDLSDEGVDELCERLNEIADEIDNIRISMEAVLENLEEEAYMQENEEQWKAEQKEQVNEYWRSVI